MKRSEANAIYRARLEFSREYEAVSCKLYDADGEPCAHTGAVRNHCQCEPSSHFSHSGCDICPGGLAAQVEDIIYLARTDIAKGEFKNIYEGQACGGCLCSLINGDDSDLDYYTTEEDEPSLSERV